LITSRRIELSFENKKIDPLKNKSSEQIMSHNKTSSDCCQKKHLKECGKSRKCYGSNGSGSSDEDRKHKKQHKHRENKKERKCQKQRKHHQKREHCKKKEECKSCQVKILTKCKIPELKYVRGSASPTVGTNIFLSDIPYVGVQGQLSHSFDAATGKFTAPRTGIYQFFYYVTWQNRSLARNDGERLMRLLRTFVTPRIENSFIGQYHSVPSQEVGLSPFYTLMSVAAKLEMEKGDTVQLAVYQNNSQEERIVAFTEFNILYVSKLHHQEYCDSNIKWIQDAQSQKIEYPHCNN
jgi:hypothetical protein